jgi:subtilisin family serine protease
MPIKVLDYTGNGFDDDIVEGIYHAVANGADVINMSIGFPGSGGGALPCSEIAGLNDALDYAHAQGVVLVAAAGNDGGIVSCPAAHPDVISVGAAGYNGLATWYSNNGAALDISAPGGDPLVPLGLLQCGCRNYAGSPGRPVRPHGHAVCRENHADVDGQCDQRDGFQAGALHRRCQLHAARVPRG